MCCPATDIGVKIQIWKKRFWVMTWHWIKAHKSFECETGKDKYRPWEPLVCKEQKCRPEKRLRRSKMRGTKTRGSLC